MSQEIILFDLPSQGGNHCWSPNTWKTRIYLNFKGLPYKTVWVEYPDIKPTLQGHVSPDETGKYTLPTVLLPDGTYIMDSLKIAMELEKRYPTPPAYLDTPSISRLRGTPANLQTNMRPELIPQVSKAILNQASLPYFLETRAESFGMPLDQVEAERGGEQCYLNARPFLKEVTAMLQENTDGPFFEGEQVTYADLVWASYLRFVERTGGDRLNKLIEDDPKEHLALLDACRPWLERDNY